MSPLRGWFCAVVLATGCSGPSLLLDPKSGGDTTAEDTSIDAFSHPAVNLSSDDKLRFQLGNAIFNTTWVTAPASVEGFDGVGPLMNSRSCTGCHTKDGRGRPPLVDTEKLESLLVRTSIPGADAHGGPLEEPSYGGQLQGDAILGVAPEVDIHVDYTEVPGQFADGESYSLRRPTLRFEALAYGPFAAGAMFSPRVAPAVHGLGLLEIVPESTIEAAADPDDKDGDGISGRVNHVWDQRRGAAVLGRFGWKANQPTLEQQSAGAFLGDMGITSELNASANCTAVQTACAAAPNGGAPELDPSKLVEVVFYGQTIAPPARRNVEDAGVQRGAALFESLGCDGCHTPTMTTGDSPIAALAHQRIHPYSDLLVHDLGDGLADHRPDFEADGNEWRTPPLWGIGLVKNVNGHTLFLHDGRARNLLEAVLWHAGEAQKTVDKFKALGKKDRDALIAFLESL